jgi:hypothetical protein
MADRGHGSKRHVSGTPDGPFIVSAERPFDGRSCKSTAENLALKMAGSGPFETNAVRDD